MPPDPPSISMVHMLSVSMKSNHYNLGSVPGLKWLLFMLTLSMRTMLLPRYNFCLPATPLENFLDQRLNMLQAMGLINQQSNQFGRR